MLSRDAGAGTDGGSGHISQEGLDADWSQIWPFWRRIVGARETHAWAPGTPET